MGQAEGKVGLLLRPAFRGQVKSFPADAKRLPREGVGPVSTRGKGKCGHWWNEYEIEGILRKMQGNRLTDTC